MSSQELMDLLSNIPNKPFQPYLDYNKKADAITVYFRPDADYSKRLTDHVTLFLSLDSQELVGCRIKGIKGLIEDLPNYLQVNHDSYELKLIFLSFRGGMEDEEKRKLLNRLAQEAGEMKVELV